MYENIQYRTKVQIQTQIESNHRLSAAGRSWLLFAASEGLKGEEGERTPLDIGIEIFKKKSQTNSGQILKVKTLLWLDRLKLTKDEF